MVMSMDRVNQKEQGRKSCLQLLYVAIEHLANKSFVQWRVVVANLGDDIKHGKAKCIVI